MGQVNCRKHYLSLRKILVLYVIAFVVLAVFLSVTTFSICDGAAEGISASYPPSGEKYYLTNEQGEQLGNGAYIGTVPVPMSKEDERTIALLEKLPIVATPIYSAFCIIAAALLFYRNRLKKPLAELRTASEKIANNDLDFSIDYDNNDELGQLCASFEIMRTTLADNFSKMWRQVEERKALNAAFAHDLRTPMTVLKGYNEMLQTSDNSQTRETAATMGKHISRMENYVSSMSNLRRMEDTQPEYKLIGLQPLISSLYDSAKIVCAKNAANQFTGAAAISFAEGMDDVQFCHRLRQILNLLFFILFGKQLLGMDVFEHPLQFSVNQVWRVEHRVALADLLLADVPCKRVHIFKKEAMNPKQVSFGKTPLDWLLQQSHLFYRRKFFFGLFEFGFIMNVQLVDQNIRIRVAVHGLHCGVDIIL